MNIHLQKIVLDYIDYKLKYEKQLLQNTRIIFDCTSNWIFYKLNDKYKCKRIRADRDYIGYYYVKYQYINNFDNSYWFISSRY